MLRNLTLVVSLLAVQSAVGTSCIPQSWPADTAALDEAYSAHELVFVANVSTIVDPETADIWWSYGLISPSLKGDVPEEGTLNVDTSLCGIPHLALEATMLIFLNNIDEPASAANSVAVVYGGGDVIEEWILEWVAKQLNDR